jgi:pilus assembly protein Flp/PilA
MSRLILRFLRNESAVTAIEYALIAGGISIVIIGTVNSIGSNLSATFYDKIVAGLN